MRKDELIYPVIIEAFHDDGDYFVVTSPNLNGLATFGHNMPETISNTEDAIATLLDAEDEYPKLQDPSTWKLGANQFVAFVTIDMSAWLKKNTKTKKRSISIPFYLDDLARKNNVNVSKVATEALEKKLV